MTGEIVSYVGYPSRTSSGDKTKFDMDYYLNGHMKLIEKHWGPHGMQSWSVTQCDEADSLDKSEPPYLVIAAVRWKALSDFHAALAAEGSKETQKDVANYTDVQPVIWVSKTTGENRNCQA